MKKTIITALFALFLAGCATAQLQKGLAGLLGQNIREATARLGYPDGQRQIMGDTIYIWSTTREAVMPYLNTTRTVGMVGNTPVYGTTSSLAFVPFQAACTIQLGAASDGMIKSYQWSGNQAGCEGYASAFPGLLRH